ncbi:MAG: dTMP kinase [bacterium]
MSGLFITIEGTDGAGKSTQIELLKIYLEKNNFDFTFVREPGGTQISEQIRNIILDSNNSSMNRVTEALLYSSSRAQLVSEVIQPALKKGRIVICDRYIDSSIAYQGFGRNLGIDLITKINNVATNGLLPDITFFLDLPPNDAFNRKKLLKNVNGEVKELDRIEKESDYFYNQVYLGYKTLAKKYSERIKTIDALNPIEKIHEEIIGHIEDLFSIVIYNNN